MSLGEWAEKFEERAIAVILGLMVIVTFINVVMRYGFSASFIWSLEITLVLFSWLVLLGMSYCVKKRAHLGVDALVNIVSRKWKRILGIAAAAVCVAYAFLLFKGAWDYWAPFAGMDSTTGRWFPTGFDENTRDRAWYETEQIPMPDFLRFFEPMLNEGERYEKLPRFIPYAILPIGALLLIFRLLRASVRIVSGRETVLIASHEVQDAIDRRPEEDEN
ncbi:MAG: TRAP transporter small permease [Albidovulum sp.]|nr:TRAP transporter small permease [Albidovulum sp.]